MSRKTFYVKACWDDDEKIFFSESDIIGLHIEAETLEDFEKVMHSAAVDLIIQNHIKPEQLAKIPLRDLIPSILWQPPQPEMACA